MPRAHKAKHISGTFKLRNKQWLTAAATTTTRTGALAGIDTQRGPGPGQVAVPAHERKFHLLVCFLCSPFDLLVLSPCRCYCAELGCLSA